MSLLLCPMLPPNHLIIPLIKSCFLMPLGYGMQIPNRGEVSEACHSL